MIFSKEHPFGRQNLDYVEMLYENYLVNPASVEPEWRAYFASKDHMPIVAMDQSDEPTGTDEQLRADTHPIIHRAPSREFSKINAALKAFLGRVPMFQSIPHHGLALLAQITEALRPEPNTYLDYCGNTDNDLYFIRSGAILIKRGEDVLTELGSGAILGELAIFDKRPRTNDIVTKTKCSLYRICRRALQELLTKNNTLAISLLRSLAERLRDVSNKQQP